VTGAPPSRLARLRERDHTQGSLLVSILVLALPALLASAIGNALTQLVDLYFLARLEDGAVAAAGATNATLRQGFFLLVMGLSTAAQLHVARAVGQRDAAAAERAAGQTFVAALGLAALAALVGVLFAHPLARAVVAADPQVVALAEVYLRLTFLLLGTSILFQLASAVLTGSGDATTPLLAMLVSSLVLVAAQWLLAFGGLGAPRLGIAGMALGVGIGGACGVALLAWVLFSGRSRVCLRPEHLRPERAALGALLGVAWQPALHLTARTLIGIFFMALAGRLGPDAQAAYTIGLRFEMVVGMIAFPVANACATLVAQNLGARRPERARAAVQSALVLEGAVLCPIAALVFWFREPLAAQFAPNAEVARLGAEYLGYSAFVMALYALYFVSFRALQARGDMQTPMKISLGCALFVGVPVGWGLALGTSLGPTGIWIGTLAYTAANTGLTAAWLWWSHRQAA
jgi:putative MATE family efflux protein